MEAAVRVQHKGRDFHVLLLSHLGVQAVLLRLSRVTYGLHVAAGDLLPHFGQRVRDGDIAQQSDVREVELDIRPAIVVGGEVGGLDACRDVDCSGSVGEAIEDGVVTLGYRHW